MNCDILHNISCHLLAPPLSSVTSNIRPHHKMIKNIWHGVGHSIKIKVPENPTNYDKYNQPNQPENKVDDLNYCFQNFFNHFDLSIWKKTLMMWWWYYIVLFLSCFTCDYQWHHQLLWTTVCFLTLSWFPFYLCKNVIFEQIHQSSSDI